MERPKVPPEWTGWLLFGLGLLVLIWRFDSGSVPANRLFDPEAIYPAALFLDLGQWASWTVPMAPYFVPDLPLFFLCMGAAGNPVVAVYLFGAAQFTLLILGIRRLFACLFVEDQESRRRTGRLVVAAATWLLVLFAFNFHGRGTFLQLFAAAFHTGSFLLAVWGEVVLLAALDVPAPGGRTKARAGILELLLFSICFFGVLSDKLLLFLFVIPAIATLLFHVRSRQPAGRLLRLSSELAAGGLLGHMAVGWINSADKIQIAVFSPVGLARTIESLSTLIRSETDMLGFALDSFFGSLGLLYRVYWFSWLGVSLLSVFLLWKRFDGVASETRRKLLFFSVLTLLAFVSTAIASAFIAVGPYSAALERPHTIFIHRYLIALYTIPLVSPALWVPLVLKPKIVARLELAQAGALGILLAVLVLGTDFSAPFPRYWPQDVECLDEKASEYDLKYGLAFFHQHPRMVNVFSKRGLHVDQISEKLAPMTWIDNRHRAGRQAGYGFVIVNRLRDWKEVAEKWGPPDREIDCPRMKVFVYDDPVFSPVPDPPGPP